VSYSRKLVLAVGSLVLITGLSIIAIEERNARLSTTALVTSLFREASSHTVTHTQAFMGRAAPIVESLTQLAGSGLSIDDPDNLARQLLPVLKANPGLSWISYGNEQGDFTGVFRGEEGDLNVNQSRIVDGKTQLTESKVLSDGNRRVTRSDPDSGYDPRNRPYYVAAKRERRLVWLPPYVFYNRGIPGVSCAAPIFGDDGRLRGVLSVDFDLNALSDFVGSLKVSPGSAVVLFTSDGTLLAAPRRERIVARGQRDTGRLLTLDDVDSPVVHALAAEMKRRPADWAVGADFQLHPVETDGPAFLASTVPFQIGPDLHWIVGVIAPASDFLSDVWRRHLITLIVAAAALAAALVLAVWLAQSVSRPVTSLIGFSRKVSGGDLEARAELGGSPEFQELSGSLNQMIADLRDRLRLRHSLDVAMHVQQRLLPEKPPTIPGLDIAGHSTYCDETGGDYYDFITVNEAASGQLVVGLGDVMGHGIAAALVMAGVRAVLRDRATSEIDLAGIMRRLNQLLAADFEGSRFMTMHLSLIDRQERRIRWVSAGHDPALVFRAQSRSFEEVEGGDLPLGIDEDVRFAESTIEELSIGDVIAIGTDGVWEMPNSSGEQFGKDRFHDLIARCAGDPAEVIARNLLAELNAFRGTARQVDDVTFAIVKVTAV
jgi:phosphoserine phosphatase RsbU/P